MLLVVSVCYVVVGSGGKLDIVYQQRVCSVWLQQTELYIYFGLSRSPSAHTLLLLKYTYVHLHNGGALCACSSLLYGALQSQCSFDTIDVTTYVRINMIGTRFCFMRSYQSRSNFCIKYYFFFHYNLASCTAAKRRLHVRARRS